VDGAFAFTFIMPKYPHRPEPALDLDMASYGQVKSYADGKDASYPDLPWEPKRSCAFAIDRFRRGRRSNVQGSGPVHRSRR
jgi:hypothetical protein